MPRQKLNTAFKSHSSASATEFNYTNGVVNELTDIIDEGRLSGQTVSVSIDEEGFTVLTFHDGAID